MREIVLDTETTGLDPAAGHRLVEIACLELNNRVPTGHWFQCYLNPEREMPAEAFKIHGLSDEFLSDQPTFPQVAERFVAFIGTSPLVIHNAEFDLKFINAELVRIGRPPIPGEHKVVDTISVARRMFPGAPASLDALCRRFEVDNSARTLHGALLDCELLAEVYLHLSGGRQPGFDLAQKGPVARETAPRTRIRRAPRSHGPSDAEREAHAAMVARLVNPLWPAGE